MEDWMPTSDERADRGDKEQKSGPKASPRALAAWQALFSDRPASESSDQEGPLEDASPIVAAEPAGEPQLRSDADAGEAPRVAFESSSGEAAPRERGAEPAEELLDEDRPASPFHVYEWVLAKLEARPSTSFMQLRKLGERGNFTVSEGHYKRARRELDGKMTELRAPQIDALVEDTLEIVRKAVGEVRGLRHAAREIAEICDDALDATTPVEGVVDLDFELAAGDEGEEPLEVEAGAPRAFGLGEAGASA